MDDLPEYASLDLPTDRELRFRPWRPEDAAAVAALYADPRAQDFVTPFRGNGAEAAERFVAGAAGHWAARRHLRLCLTDDSDAVLGSGDLDDLWTAERSSDLGWWVAESARGRGLGVRLARLLVRVGRETLGLHRITAHIAAPNDASRWVAAGAGLRLESTARDLALRTDGSWVDVETWALLAGEEPLDAQPELTAGALHLRPWKPSDAAAVHAICQDPEVLRWTRLPDPYTEEEAARWVTRTTLTGWATGDAAQFAVLDATTAEVLASVSAFNHGSGVWELGYFAGPAARGRGVVTAASRSLLRWLFATQGAEVVEWHAARGNDASWRVAEKLGFVREGTLRARSLRRGTTSPRVDIDCASLLPGELR